ncbi:hypothetical protein DEDE109153_15795 [Deinococcus deserti]
MRRDVAGGDTASSGKPRSVCSLDEYVPGLCFSSGPELTLVRVEHQGNREE